MILTGGRVAVGPEEAIPMDLAVQAGRLRVPASGCVGPRLDLRGLLLLPGLINAHDHLEFNLFPRLGAGPYPNATAWAGDIYQPDQPPVREHLTVPKSARLRWGALKNLISGVTTVMHHNPYSADFDGDFPVRVVSRFGWAHSPHFSPDFAARYRATPADVPFVIHACEGIDAGAASEIHTLHREGVVGPNTVLVHGAALDAAGLAILQSHRASLVWCPTSNHFTLGRSLPLEALASGIPIALGTDSALTGRGDMTDETTAASRQASWVRIYRMVTSDAAAILRLRDGEGQIRDGGVADLVAVRDIGQTPAQALEGLRPELVIVDGRVRLITEERAARVGSASLKFSRRMEVENRGSWLTDCDVRSIWDLAAQAVGNDVRLCGRRVAC